MQTNQPLALLTGQIHLTSYQHYCITVSKILWFQLVFKLILLVLLA